MGMEGEGQRQKLCGPGFNMALRDMIAVKGWGTEPIRQIRPEEQDSWAWVAGTY